MNKLFKMLVLLTAFSMIVSACVPAATPAPATAAATQVQQPQQTQSSGGGEVEPIKIGALYPLTGPDAGWAGDPYIKSHQMAIDEINAAGGIKCLNGAKLELVKGDTKSQAEPANLEMERLITKEGVIAVMGDVISGTTIPDSEIAEKYEIPYIIPNSLDGRLVSRGMKYMFMTVSTMQDWGKYDVQWAKDHGAKTAVITTPNFSFGEEVQGIWSKAIEEIGGIQLLDNIRYDGNAQDFTDTILKIKKSDPDVLFLLGNNQATTLVKQLKEQGYYPKMGIITLGSGFATSFFLKEVTPELAEGIIFTMDFAPVSKLPVSEDFKTKFKEYTGQDLGGTYNTTYASTWLLADALEKSCSRDPKKLAETLRTTKFEKGEWSFQWPSASFSENGLLKEAPTVIGQWQNGQMVAVWPDNLAAAQPVWPVPGWDNRAGGIGAPPVTTAPEATQAAANDPALASDYSQALLKDAATDVDTSMYKKDGPYTIAVSQQDPSNGWGNTYNVTIAAYGKELLDKGILAKPLLVSATNDANQQISDVENFIEQKPDAIVIEPAGRAASVAVIGRAIDAGIPVILCANGIEGDKFTTRVDVDFYEVAYKSGDGLAKLMGGKGNIVVFNGIAGVDSTETWVKAAKDAWSHYPDIKVVAEEYAQWNIATAKQKMEAIMAANPQIDGVWAGGGEMALGAALAYEDAGKTAPKFGMVNVPNGFLRLADQYKYQFVGSPDPPSMSKYCLQTAIDILQGKPVKKFISLRTLMEGAEPYDFSNFAQWFVPQLNDDFIPPMTVDVQYYIDGGFGRK